MTTPTDDELDALVAELTEEAMHLGGWGMDQGSCQAGLAANLATSAADAITALRAELAAERAKAIEAVEAHFPGRLYASNRMDCIAAITSTKGATK